MSVGTLIVVYAGCGACVCGALGRRRGRYRCCAGVEGFDRGRWFWVFVMRFCLVWCSFFDGWGRVITLMFCVFLVAVLFFVVCDGPGGFSVGRRRSLCGDDRSWRLCRSSFGLREYEPVV